MPALKRLWRAIALIALAVLVAEPGLSLAASPFGYRRLDGQLVLLQADDFVSGRTGSWFSVQTDYNRFIRADISGLRHTDRLVGERVALAGQMVGSEFVATASLGSEPLAAAAATPTARKTAIILLNFTNDRTQPWTTSFVSSTVFGDTASVNAYYEEVSYGSTGISGTVTNWTTVPYDNTGCRYSEWGQAALAASGIDTSQYAHVVYAFPRTLDCSWAGLSTVGGKFSWINGYMTVRTVGHELAHSMGVHHASALNCVSNGSRVTWSSTCTRSEYGDPYSIMGTGTRHLNNWHRAQIGWVTETQTLTSSGTYTVAPTELTAQPRLVRIARGDGNYLYLEYRRPFGAYDNFASSAAAVNGVTIRVAPDKPTRKQSLLLDMTPSTATFEDAPLAVGRSFVDQVSGIKVTTSAASATSATVTVTWPGTVVGPGPTPPPSPSPTPNPTASPSASPPPTDAPATSALSAPTDVRAVRLDGRKVRVTWKASSGAIAGYWIVRNGVRIRGTTALSIVDNVPRGVVRVRYRVRAYDRWGNVGPLSSVLTIYVR